MYGKNNFVEVSKNLAKYRFKNNFVELKVIMWNAQTDY